VGAVVRANLEWSEYPDLHLADFAMGDRAGRLLTRRRRVADATDPSRWYQPSAARRHMPQASPAAYPDRRGRQP
jgi:hypothetical protein